MTYGIVCSNPIRYPSQVGSYPTLVKPWSNTTPSRRRQHDGNPNRHKHNLNITQHKQPNNRPLHSSQGSPGAGWLRHPPSLSVPKFQPLHSPLRSIPHDHLRPLREMALHPDASQTVPALATGPVKWNMGGPALASPVQPRPRSIRKKLLRLGTIEVRRCTNRMQRGPSHNGTIQHASPTGSGL